MANVIPKGDRTKKINKIKHKNNSTAMQMINHKMNATWQLTVECQMEGVCVCDSDWLL